MARTLVLTAAALLIGTSLSYFTLMTWLSNEATNAASLLLAMLVVCLSLRLSAELRVALTRRSFRRSFRQDSDQTKGARERAASLAGTSTVGRKDQANVGTEEVQESSEIFLLI